MDDDLGVPPFIMEMPWIQPEKFRKTQLKGDPGPIDMPELSKISHLDDQLPEKKQIMWVEQWKINNPWLGMVVTYHL